MKMRGRRKSRTWMKFRSARRRVGGTGSRLARALLLNYAHLPAESAVPRQLLSRRRKSVPLIVGIRTRTSTAIATGDGECGWRDDYARFGPDWIAEVLPCPAYLSIDTLYLI